MDDWEWDDLEHGTHSVATNLIVRTRQTSETPRSNKARSNKDPPLTSQLHHSCEEEERKTEDDYSDWEMDNLDWDVLEHSPNRDTITESESTGFLSTSLTCQQRQA